MFQRHKTITEEVKEMAKLVRALNAVPEDPDLNSNTHTEAHNCP